MKPWRLQVAASVVVLAAGCSVSMGGPKPVDTEAAVIVAGANAAADQIATQLVERGVDYAIIAANRDTTFFRDIATRANLKSTRPANLGTATFAFIGPQALGDTALTLSVPGGGQIRIHDALYKVDKARHLDLLAARIEPNTNLQQAIQRLLNYVATDVGATAALLLAIEPPTPALGDSVSVLTRAAFADVWECTQQGRGGASGNHLPIRVFVGPAVRMRCESAEVADIGGNAIVGQFELPR